MASRIMVNRIMVCRAGRVIFAGVAGLAAQGRWLNLGGAAGAAGRDDSIETRLVRSHQAGLIRRGLIIRECGA
jgi:hypothetical protein